MKRRAPSDDKHYFSKVTAKGQITLPVRLRQRLGIRSGDLVEISARGNGKGGVIEVWQRPSLIESTAGLARPRGPFRWHEWDEIEEIGKDETARRFFEEEARR